VEEGGTKEVVGQGQGLFVLAADGIRLVQNGSNPALLGQRWPWNAYPLQELEMSAIAFAVRQADGLQVMINKLLIPPCPWLHDFYTISTKNEGIRNVFDDFSVVSE